MFGRADSNLGINLISELGRRGQRGMYFKNAGYRRLPGIESVDDLRQFLDDYHFDVVPASVDVVAVADGIDAFTAAESKKASWISFLASFDSPVDFCHLSDMDPTPHLYWAVWDPKKSARKIDTRDKRGTHHISRVSGEADRNCGRPA